MIYKNCPRCKKLMPYGKTYCESCSAIIAAERKKRKAENDRRYNQRRDAKYKKFYNSDPWKSLSEARLSRDKHWARLEQHPFSLHGLSQHPAQQIFEQEEAEVSRARGWLKKF